MRWELLRDFERFLVPAAVAVLVRLVAQLLDFLDLLFRAGSGFESSCAAPEQARTPRQTSDSMTARTRRCGAVERPPERRDCEENAILSRGRTQGIRAPRGLKTFTGITGSPS